jgi:hypothetical protein
VNGSGSRSRLDLSGPPDKSDGGTEQVWRWALEDSGDRSCLVHRTSPVEASGVRWEALESGPFTGLEVQLGDVFVLHPFIKLFDVSLLIV